MTDNNAPVEHVCETCTFWIKEYHSCYNGKSSKRAEFTKPEESCGAWQKKIYKARMLKYDRKKKGEM